MAAKAKRAARKGSAQVRRRALLAGLRRTVQELEAENDTLTRRLQQNVDIQRVESLRGEVDRLRTSEQAMREALAHATRDRDIARKANGLADLEAAQLEVKKLCDVIGAHKAAYAKLNDAQQQDRQHMGHMKRHIEVLQADNKALEQRLEGLQHWRRASLDLAGAMHSLRLAVDDSHVPLVFGSGPYVAGRPSIAEIEKLIDRNNEEVEKRIAENIQRGHQ